MARQCPPYRAEAGREAGAIDPQKVTKSIESTFLQCFFDLRLYVFLQLYSQNAAKVFLIIRHAGWHAVSLGKCRTKHCNDK
jgi:hypothetical protein